MFFFCGGCAFGVTGMEMIFLEDRAHLESVTSGRRHSVAGDVNKLRDVTSLFTAIKGMLTQRTPPHTHTHTPAYTQTHELKRRPPWLETAMLTRWTKLCDRFPPFFSSSM